MEAAWPTKVLRGRNWKFVEEEGVRKTRSFLSTATARREPSGEKTAEETAVEWKLRRAMMVPVVRLTRQAKPSMSTARRTGLREEGDTAKIDKVERLSKGRVVVRAVDKSVKTTRFELG